MAINFVRYLSAPAGTLETEAAPGQNGPAAPTVSAPPGATAGAAEGDWPSYNKTLTSDRFSQLNQINRDNVGKLKVNTAERQAALMLVGLRDRLIRNRTQLANAIRGNAAEFGLAAIRCSIASKPMRAYPRLARELYAIQDIELMPQYQDFGFQPPPRLEAVAQHADEKEGNCNHATICSDSLLTASQGDGVAERDIAVSITLYDCGAGGPPLL